MGDSARPRSGISLPPTVDDCGILHDGKSWTLACLEIDNEDPRSGTSLRGRLWTLAAIDRAFSEG